MPTEWLKTKANAVLKGGTQLTTKLKSSFKLMGNQQSGEKTQTVASGDVKPGSITQEGGAAPVEEVVLGRILHHVRSERVREEFLTIDESEYTTSHEVKIQVFSYNVNGRKPNSMGPIDELLGMWRHNWPSGGDPGPDIVVLGFQEVVPLSASNVLTGWNADGTKDWEIVVDAVLNPWKREALKKEMTQRQAESPISRAGSAARLDVAALMARGWGGFKNVEQPVSLMDVVTSISESPAPNHGSKAEPVPHPPPALAQHDFGIPGSWPGHRYAASESGVASTTGATAGAASNLGDECPLAAFADELSVDSEQQTSWEGASSARDPEVEPEEEFEFKLSGEEGGEAGVGPTNEQEYVLVVSKQLVGVYLAVWARRWVLPHMCGVQATSVATGAMGFLANKGAILARMRVYDTSLCFVTSHFASGEADGDELRRNLDYSEIYRRAEFPHEIGPDNAGRVVVPPEGLPVGAANEVKRTYLGGSWGNYRKLMHHDSIVWMGDLNYRLMVPYETVLKAIRTDRFEALFEHDQLEQQRAKGHVFGGWKEGPITFAPTYKFVRGTDYYVGEKVPAADASPALADLMDLSQGFESDSDVSELSRPAKAIEYAWTGNPRFLGPKAAANLEHPRGPLGMNVCGHSPREFPPDQAMSRDAQEGGAKGRQLEKESDQQIGDLLDLASTGSAPGPEPAAKDRVAAAPQVLERTPSTTGSQGPPSTAGPPVSQPAKKAPKKIRTPAWTDRVLWTSSGQLHQLLYGRAEIMMSDHKPVSAAFILQAKEYLREQVEENVHAARRAVDVSEMAHMPRCSVEPQILEAGLLEYDTPVGLSLIVSNVGEVDAMFKFVPPPKSLHDSQRLHWGSQPPFPKWLTASVEEGQVGVGQSVEVKLTLRITGGVDGAADDTMKLHNGQVDQILVLRLEGGNDFFISVTGTYQPSAFGLNLEQLAMMPKPGPRTDDSSSTTPLRTDVSLSTPRGSRGLSHTLSGLYSNLTAGPGKELLPTQLSRMLQFLWVEDRLSTPGLFVDDLRSLKAAAAGGTSRAGEMTTEIRRCLDCGQDFPDSVGAHEMATTLLAFFRDLPTPLVPWSIAQACDAGMLPVDMSVQLMQDAMTPIEWSVMKSTLEAFRRACSQEALRTNGLTVASLAAVLADVWFYPLGQADELERPVDAEEPLDDSPNEALALMLRRAQLMELFLKPGATQLVVH